MHGKRAAIRVFQQYQRLPQRSGMASVAIMRQRRQDRHTHRFFNDGRTVRLNLLSAIWQHMGIV